MLDAIERTARSAAAAWRRSRAIEAGLTGLSIGLLALVLHALALELGAGLEVQHLPPLLLWLLLAPLAALAAALRPVDLSTAATEADARAGLADRLGTALEFAAADAPLVAAQRADAAAIAATTAVGPLFPVPWGRHLPRLLALLVLALFVTGMGLTFQLRPAAVEPTVLAEEDDLLASIDRAIDEYEEVGDKEAVRLLTDLDRTIRQIRAQESRLRKAVARKAAEPPPEDDVEPEALPPAPKPRTDNKQRITADELARLEEETVDQLALTDAQQQDMVAQLFQHTRTATEMMHEFHHHEIHEAEVSAEAANAAVRDQSTGQSVDNTVANNQDLSGLDDVARNTNTQGITNQADEREDMIRRDLSDESQAAHDRAHDTQESFNQFLRDFVKDVQEIVAEAAVGKQQKKKNNGREVQVNNGQGVEDKTDALAESGFEEMGDTKRHSDQAPPEDLAGLPSQPGQGPPPEGAQMSEGSGTPEGPRMQGDSGGETSAGAEGAGSGNPNQGDGLAALLHGLEPQEGGRLEQALGQLAQGRMPPDVREQLLDRVARHKVQAGLASEADDVLVDYFADADDLMIENQDSLPPLFRDYARSYFDSIKPGGSADADAP